MGTSLALALVLAGGRLEGYACATHAGRERAAAHLGAGGHVGIPSLVQACAGRVDLYLLCVPDALIEEAARELAGALRSTGASQAPRGRLADLTVAHTSGATSTSALSSCAAAGAVTLSLHPLQTFTDPALGPDRLAGCAVAVTPGDAERFEQAWQLGERISLAVGARPFRLAERDRVLYHAAATVASNYLVTLAHVAEGLLGEAGFPADAALPALLPLMRGAVDNLAAQGSVAALTGPLSRGDAPTVAAHLAELEHRSAPSLSLYRELGKATLDLVRLRREVPEDTVALLSSLLAGPAAPGAAPLHLPVQLLDPALQDDAKEALS